MYLHRPTVAPYAPRVTTAADREQAEDQIRRELRRVTDRLLTVPLDRLGPIADHCRRTGEVLLAHTHDPDRPADAALPRLAAGGLGAMIAVLGADYVDRIHTDADPESVLVALVDLRRALP